MFYIYIIQSKSADIFYVGYSTNPWKRLDEHNISKPDRFTGKYADWELAVVFSVSENRSDAVKVERFIKAQKNRKFILRLISEDFVPTGKLSQLVRVPHLRD